MNLAATKKLVAKGESDRFEFKKSTAQLKGAGQTLCAFLNAEGGNVIFGVTDNGKVVGQEVSDKTRREIAMMLDRAHARRRWENQPAVDVTLDHLDHEEILRTREAAIQQRRISASTSTDVGDILDRLGLRRDGFITQAAQVLYGTRFLPDYPRGILKMGRFRGTKITGDILDNRQEHLHAFAIVREATAWLDRTLPLAAHFPKGKIFREDRLPVPPEALREVILNAGKLRGDRGLRRSIRVCLCSRVQSDALCCLYNRNPSAVGKSVTVRPGGDHVGDILEVYTEGELVGVHRRADRQTTRRVTLEEHRGKIVAETKERERTETNGRGAGRPSLW